MRRLSHILSILGPCALFAAPACKTAEPPPPDAAAAPAEAAPPALDRVDRKAFNLAAVELHLPLFWVADTDEDGAVDPDEVAVLWGVADTARADWVGPDGFTDRFTSAYDDIASYHAEGPDEAGLSEAETARRAKVREELRQGQPTVVLTEMEGASEQDRAILTHIMNAAEIVERIHAKQRGAHGMAADIPEGDTASRAMFHRNQGPWCVAPRTEDDEACSALPSQPKQISGLYPAAVQTEGFCEELSKREDAETLMHQFHVVREQDGELIAVPYHEAYAEDMKAVSRELQAAADAIEGDEEAAFKAYLEAAAQSFLTNDWEPANEAWSKMSVDNSKWYLRIGPDEVYFEPCSRKAGFHVSFARINEDSLEWQKKLDPVKQDMEEGLAKLAGKPYRARDVSFHLPDFIDIVLNAGDSRSPHGATIGQSLPNWGPVANEGRGRTVAMTNLYTDPDSKAELRKQARSLLCGSAMEAFTDDPTPQIMSTVLHEAAHNLGPAHEYQVRGKTDDQVFGGPMASTMEELKAQTAALYFTDWLVERDLIEPELAKQAHLRDLIWSFGHISRGMYSSSGKPKPYSQLAAIQLGFLEQAGVVKWHEDRKAANGEDTGCFTMDMGAYPAAAEKLMKKVAGIKARGDEKAALQLRADFVDAEERKARMATIAERWLRAPKASFVYAVEK